MRLCYQFCKTSSYIQELIMNSARYYILIAVLGVFILCILCYVLKIHNEQNFVLFPINGSLHSVQVKKIKTVFSDHAYKLTQSRVHSISLYSNESCLLNSIYWVLVLVELEPMTFGFNDKTKSNESDPPGAKTSRMELVQWTRRQYSRWWPKYLVHPLQETKFSMWIN